MKNERRKREMKKILFKQLKLRIGLTPYPHLPKTTKFTFQFITFRFSFQKVWFIFHEQR